MKINIILLGFLLFFYFGCHNVKYVQFSKSKLAEMWKDDECGEWGARKFIADIVSDGIIKRNLKIPLNDLLEILGEPDTIISKDKILAYRYAIGRGDCKYPFEYANLVFGIDFNPKTKRITGVFYALY